MAAKSVTSSEATVEPPEEFEPPEELEPLEELELPIPIFHNCAYQNYTPISV